LQKNIAIGLVLIVLLPIGLLGWFGVRMANNEQQVIEHQLQTLLMAQLKHTNNLIQAYFQAEQKNFLNGASRLDSNAEGIREFVRRSPQVRQVLVMAADGKRVFPPLDGPLSDAERQFMQRTAAIWDNPAILPHSAAVGPLAAAVDKISSPARDAGQSGYGWYAWHWNAELHHIFWWRDPLDRLVGVELAPVRVISDIIGRLPSTGSGDDNLGNANIRLINANGQIAYQWGRYQPGPKEQTLSMLPLSHPLASWRLEYYGPALAAGTASNWLSMAAAVLAVALALAGLAYYLYREHTREMRVAAQRVNFVNQVSHELKTPLTNIRMYAELLEEALAEEHDKPRKYIAIITAESQRLSRLIANVLSFARASRQHLVLHLRPGRIDDIINRCIEAFMPAFKAKAIEVRFAANAPALVGLDVEAIEQILNNLISNVEKYAAGGALMEVSSVQQGKLTLILVRDFGPGISRREQDRIFQPFYRVSSRLSDGVAGTGIGLGIARQLARLHGGDLKHDTVEHGACFRISLLTESAGET
jgi:signal transduction histidine kinase